MFGARSGDHVFSPLHVALPICFDLGMIDSMAARDFFISYTSADRA
jgi:hypothetical protein